MGILNGGRVSAVYDYEAQNSDELTFRMGDELIVLRKGDDYEREWWWSRLSDHEGYVPRNLLGVSPRPHSIFRLHKINQHERHAHFGSIFLLNATNMTTRSCILGCIVRTRMSERRPSRSTFDTAYTAPHHISVFEIFVCLCPSTVLIRSGSYIFLSRDLIKPHFTFGS